MKFVVDKNNFLWAIDKINHIVPTHPKIPVLTNIHFTTRKPVTLTIEATDLEIGSKIDLKTKVTEDGECLINGRFLAEAIRELKGESISTTIEKNEFVIIVPETTLKINITTKDEYPIITWGEKEEWTEEMGPTVLEEILQMVAFSASKDEIRPILTGVFFSDAGEVVTTDGIRLSVFKPSKTISLTNTIVPLGFLRQLAATKGGKIKVRYDLKKKRVIALVQPEEGDYWLQSQLIEGNFPNYKEIVPQEFNYNLVVNKTLFEQQLRTVMVVAKNNGNLLKLDIKDKKITLLAESSTFGSVKGEVEIENDQKKELTLALNGKFLQEAIGVIDEEYLVIKLNTATSPIMIQGVEKDNYYHILMPINLQE